MLDDGTGTNAKDLANRFDGLFNDVDDNDQANYVSNSSEDELNRMDETSIGSTETFDPWNKNKDEKWTRTTSHQSRGSRFVRSRSRRRRNFRTQKEMERKERKFDHKKIESKGMSSEEEERQT